jgi:hypothetical protein
MGFLRITCPACKESFTTYERSRHKTGLLYSTMICPHCGTELRPDLPARVLTCVICVIAAVVMGIHFFVPGPFDSDYTLLGLTPVVAGFVWLAMRARWEPLPGSATKAPPAEAAKRAARATGVAAVKQPATDNYAYKYSTRPVTKTDRYGTVFFGVFLAGIFYYLLTLQSQDSAYVQVFVVLMCLSAALTFWAAFFFPKQQHVEIDGVCIRTRRGERTKTIAWQDIRQVREPGALNGIVITSRSGERMRISKTLEGFAQFREELIEHLSVFYAQRSATGRTFWCVPGVAVLLIICSLVVIGMMIMLLVYKQFMPQMLAVFPVLAAMIVGAGYAPVSVQLLREGLRIRRVLWKPRLVPYAQIREVSIHESIFPLLGMPTPNKGSPGVIVTLREDAKTVAITTLWNGPMEFYWQLRKVASGN